VRLLLDAHAALWWFNDDRRLSAPARRAIEDVGSERFLSVAAAWEMAIKSSLGRLKLPVPVGRFLQEHLPRNHIELLAIGIGDLTLVETLVFHHRDPFDRLMAAQALERGLAVVSSDAIFKKYDVERIW
jgi:PIN domain nuclease of toxin-antitoxin system